MNKALLSMVLAASLPAPALADDVKIAHFESPGYPADWILTGTAFGDGPAHATLPNQQPVSGTVGTGYINSFHGGDDTKGALQLAAFTVQRPYIKFLAGGGNHPAKTAVELVVDGKSSDKRWVLHAAKGDYILGAFDGTRFVKEAGSFAMDYGKNWYASQSYSEIPAADGASISPG